jgi:hypothetical protein
MIEFNIHKFIFIFKISIQKINSNFVIKVIDIVTVIIIISLH